MLSALTKMRNATIKSSSGLQEGERIVSGGNFLIDAEAQVQGALRNFGEEQAPGSIGSDSSGSIGEK